ncbi:hypothetical protein [Pseudomonas sp. FEN]|uniref:hypothetical protein n=1 Tax=Pseudomonas sp. FEN TaxID=2767468 RepID=UPI0017493183|nr:hypothetical protein [Pseudomonas sp. FEN]
MVPGRADAEITSSIRRGKPIRSLLVADALLGKFKLVQLEEPALTLSLETLTTPISDRADRSLASK